MLVAEGDDFIEAEQGPLHGIDMDMNHIPDAAMTIATTALFAEGTTTIRNIYNWRVKETDRLHAMATELRKLGVEVEEGHDFITVIPPAELARWKKATDEQDDEWVQTMNKRGLNGAALLKDAQDLIKQHTK